MTESTKQSKARPTPHAAAVEAAAHIYTMVRKRELTLSHFASHAAIESELASIIEHAATRRYAKLVDAAEAVLAAHPSNKIGFPALRSALAEVTKGEKL